MKQPRVESSKLAAAINKSADRKGLAINELSVATGIHPSQVCRILNGDFKRYSTSLEKLCGFLGVEPSSCLEAAPATISREEAELVAKFRRFIQGDSGRRKAVDALFRAFAQFSTRKPPSAPAEAL